MSRRCYKSRACNHDQKGGPQYSGSRFGGEIAKASVFDGLHFVYGGSGVGDPSEAKMVELSGLERVNGVSITLGQVHGCYRIDERIRPEFEPIAVSPD